MESSYRRRPPRLMPVTVSEPDPDELLEAIRGGQRMEPDPDALLARVRQPKPVDRLPDLPHADGGAGAPAKRPATWLETVGAAHRGNQPTLRPEMQELPGRAPITITAAEERDPAVRKAAAREVARMGGASEVGQAVAEFVDPAVLTGQTRNDALLQEQGKFSREKVEAARGKLASMKEQAELSGDLPTMQHLQRLEGNVGAYLAAFDEQATLSGSTRVNLAATLGETGVDRDLARGAAELPEALATLGITDDDGNPLSFAAPFGIKQFGGMAVSDLITSLVGGKMARTGLGVVEEYADDVARTASAGSRAARLMPKIAAAARATARLGTGADITVERSAIAELRAGRQALREVDRVGSAMATGATQGQVASTIREVNQAQAQGREVAPAVVEGLLMGSVVGAAGEQLFRGVAEGIRSANRSWADHVGNLAGEAFDVARSSAPAAPGPDAGGIRLRGTAGTRTPEAQVREAFRSELSTAAKPGTLSWIEMETLLSEGIEPQALVERYSTAVTPEARSAQVTALEAYRQRALGGRPTPSTLEPTPVAPVPQNAPTQGTPLLPPAPTRRLLTAGEPAPAQGPAIPMEGTAADKAARDPGTPNQQVVREFEALLRTKHGEAATRAAAEAKASVAANDPKRMPFRELLKRSQAQGLRHGVAPLGIVAGEDSDDPRVKAIMELGALSMLATTKKGSRGVLKKAAADATAVLEHGSTRAAKAATQELQVHVRAIRALREAIADRRPLTSEERLAGMRLTERAKQGWYDVRGQKARSPEEVVALLRPLRSQKMERYHNIFTNAKGKVLAHTMETSGVRNAIQFGRGVKKQGLRGDDDLGPMNAWIDEVADRAKRLGATTIWGAHNHPSGLAMPSGPDVQMTLYVRDQLKAHGIDYRGQVVLDHTHYGWADPGQLNTGTRALAMKAIPGDVDVTEASLGIQTYLSGEHPSDRVAAFARRVEQRLDGQAVYLDGQGKIVAVEPHHAEALGRLDTWLTQRMRGHGAGRVMFVVGDESTADLIRQQETRRADRSSPTRSNRAYVLPPGVTDVIVDAEYGTAKASDGTEQRPYGAVRSDVRGRMAEGPYTERNLERGGPSGPMRPIRNAWFVREDPVATHRAVVDAAANLAEPLGSVPQEYHNSGRHSFTRDLPWTPEASATLAQRLSSVLRPGGRDVVAEALGTPPAAHADAEGLWQGSRSANSLQQLPPETSFRDIELRAAAQQLLFGQDGAMAFRFLADDADLSSMSPAQRAVTLERMRRAGVVEGLSDGEKDGILDALAADNINATAARDASGGWSVLVVDEQHLPALFDEGFQALVDDIAPGRSTYVGHVESSTYAGPRAAGEALLRHRPESLRALAGLLDGIGPEYVRSADELGGVAAAERTRASVAARKRGLLALADAVERPSPPAATRNPRTVDAAHRVIVDERNANGKAPKLRALEGEQYVEQLAQEFAQEADVAIQRAVELTGDPATTTRWYGKTVTAAQDIAAAFGLPEIAEDPHLGFLFHTVSSILSNGQPVFREYLTAVPVLQQYLRTGQLTLTLPEGSDLPGARGLAGSGDEGPIPRSMRWNTHDTQLRRLQKMIEKDGLPATVDYLSSPEVKSPKKGNVVTRRDPVTGEKRPVTAMVREFNIKIGQYARDKLGLSSEAHDGVTVDVWMHRLERLLRGESMDSKPDKFGKLAAAGPTPVETLRIQAATKRARQLLEVKHPGIQPRDVQTALWERAKTMYAEAGAREKPGAYDTLQDAARRYVTGEGLRVRDPQQVRLLQRYLPQMELPALGVLGLSDDDEAIDTTVALEGFALAMLGRGLGTYAERALGISAASDIAKRFGTSASLVAAGAVLAGSEDPDVARFGTAMALGLGGLHALGTAPAKVGGRALLEQTRRVAAQSPTLARTFGWFTPALVLSDETLAALKAARLTITTGRTRAREVANKAAEAGPQADRLASDLVEGEAWENAALMDPDARQAAVEVAARYQVVMQEAMRRELALGTLPAEVVAKLPHDRYLPRVYAEHLKDGVLAPSTEGGYSQGSALTIHGPRRRVLDVPVYEAMDDLEAVRQYLSFAQQRGDPVQVAAAQAALGEAQLKVTTAIRERDATRLRLGEVREFSWRAPAAIEDAFGRMAAGELLQTLKTTGDVHPEWLAAAAARDAGQQAFDTALDAPARAQLREELAAATARLEEVRKQLPGASLDAAELTPTGQAKGPAEGVRQQWMAEYQAAAETVRSLRDAIATAGNEQIRQAARQQVNVAEAALRDLGARLEADKQAQWVQLPSSASYGPLAGAIVKRAVADELSGVADPAYWGGFMRFWKGMKTRYNLSTHVGNTASNTVMLHMAGLSWWQQPAYLARAIGDYRVDGRATQRLRELGILGQADIAQGAPKRAAARTPRQTRSLRSTTRPETAQALEAAGIALPTKLDKVANAGDAVNSKVTAAYQAEDDLFRLVAYDFAQRKLNLPEPAAAEWARSALGDFSRGQSSRAVRLLRNTGAPFIAYPLAALPAFAQHIIDKPWRWVSLTAPLLLMNEWGQAESKHDLGPRDVGPRERDTVFGLLMPNLVQVPMSRDERDRVPAMDLSRWTPLSALTTGAPSATLGGALEAPSLLTPSGPLFDIPAIVAANRESPFSNRPLVSPMMGGGEQSQKLANAAADLLLPSMFGFSLRRLAKDVERRDPQGVALDVAGYVGVRPRYYGKDEDYRRATRERDERLRTIDYEAKDEMRKGRRNPSLIEDVRRERDRRRQATLEAFNQRTNP